MAFCSFCPPPWEMGVSFCMDVFLGWKIIFITISALCEADGSGDSYLHNLKTLLTYPPIQGEPQQWDYYRLIKIQQHQADDDAIILVFFFRIGNHQKPPPTLGEIEGIVRLVLIKSCISRQLRSRAGVSR